MDDVQKQARVRAYRLMQWAGAGSTLLIAACLYVYFPDKTLEKATAIGFGVFALLLFLLWKNPVSLWISLGIAGFGLAQIGFLQMLISLEKINEG